MATSAILNWNIGHIYGIPTKDGFLILFLVPIHKMLKCAS